MTSYTFTKRRLIGGFAKAILTARELGLHIENTGDGQTARVAGDAEKVREFVRRSF